MPEPDPAIAADAPTSQRRPRRLPTDRAKDPDERLRLLVEIAVRRVTSRGDDEFEDIVQTSLASILVAVRSRPFQGEPSAPWVLRVARNVAIDRMRARSRERRMFFRGDGAPADASSSSALDPDHLTHVRDELRRFDVGLQRIGSARSAVVYLHDVLGHGLAHIADALCISVTAAQSRLIRGRRALRRQLLS